MSMGKGGGDESTTVVEAPELSQEQKDFIKAQTAMYTGIIGPSFQTAVKGATNLYNQSVGGVNAAAQNLAGTAAQAQETLGGTGEAALRTGVSGLAGLFNPDYERQQITLL